MVPMMHGVMPQRTHHHHDNELIAFLQILLAEALNLQDHDAIAQLHETIRCLRQFETHEYAVLKKFIIPLRSSNFIYRTYLYTKHLIVQGCSHNEKPKKFFYCFSYFNLDKVPHKAWWCFVIIIKFHYYQEVSLSPCFIIARRYHYHQEVSLLPGFIITSSFIITVS